MSCDSCKAGWILDETQGCLDVDECTQADANCEYNNYCLNTEGSFVCKGCHETCDGCHGSGPADCITCSVGYTRDNEQGSECIDIDECFINETSCSGVGEKCVNAIGSFKCVCRIDYTLVRGKCQLKNKANKKKKKDVKIPLQQKPTHPTVPDKQIFTEKLDESMEGFEETLKVLSEPLKGVPIEESIIMEGSVNANDDVHSATDSSQETLADKSDEDYQRIRDDL